MIYWGFINYFKYHIIYSVSNSLALCRLFNRNGKGNIMAIINKCPLTGIINRCNNTSLHLHTNYLNHVMGLSIDKLTDLSNASDLPNLAHPTDTRLVFCALAKQSNLLVHHRQLLSVSDKIVFTHFNLLKSIAIYLHKEPKFAKRIPKYAHYTGISMENFGHYLELIKQEKELYIAERNNLKQRYKEPETLLNELTAIDIAETKLGMLESRYATKLKLTEETSNNFSVSKQLAQYMTVAMQVANELKDFYCYIISSPVSTLRNDSEVKEIDLVDVIESIEDWETNLNIKYAILSFLRKKLAAYNSYEGRKVSKIDISDLDFLLGDIELVESKTVESTARSEAVTNTPIPTQVSNSINTQVSNAEKEELSKPKVSTNSTSLAESILAKIAAKKKGN